MNRGVTKQKLGGLGWDGTGWTEVGTRPCGVLSGAVPLPYCPCAPQTNPIIQLLLPLFYGVRFREVKRLVQGHTARKGQNGEAEPLAPNTLPCALLFPLRLRCVESLVLWGASDSWVGGVGVCLRAGRDEAGEGS